MLLPSPKKLKALLPLHATTSTSIQETRQVIRQVITKNAPIFSIILGPCSLHNVDSAIEYAKRVKELQKQVSSNCLLIMRAHIEKPRSHLGWKGLLHDPHLQGTEDVAEGIIFCRELLLSLALLDVPLATEFLDPLASSYFSDLISWGFIGARTCTSQIHRQLASHLPMPMGFKNTTEGSIESAIYGALCAKRAHSFLYMDEDGKVTPILSQGNPYSHIVLRGSHISPNYDKEEVQLSAKLSIENGLHSRILIDCSHGNSQKHDKEQEDVFLSVIKQKIDTPDIIMGLMLESHLEKGSQSFSSSSNPSLSITDPCIDWGLTEKLVLLASSALDSSLLGSSS